VAPQRRAARNGRAHQWCGQLFCWLHRYFRYRPDADLAHANLPPRRAPWANGVPAAIAAKLADPSREVIAFAGDGCFQMTAWSSAPPARPAPTSLSSSATTAVYGTIRMHQERTYPGRVVGTSMRNPGLARRCCGLCQRRGWPFRMVARRCEPPVCPAARFAVLWLSLWARRRSETGEGDQKSECAGLLSSPLRRGRRTDWFCGTGGGFGHMRRLRTAAPNGPWAAWRVSVNGSGHRRPA
jgi:hypothetical protein